MGNVEKKASCAGARVPAWEGRSPHLAKYHLHSRCAALQNLHVLMRPISFPKPGTTSRTPPAIKTACFAGGPLSAAGGTSGVGVQSMGTVHMTHGKPVVGEGAETVPLGVNFLLSLASVPSLCWQRMIFYRMARLPHVAALKEQVFRKGAVLRSCVCRHGRRGRQRSRGVRVQRHALAGGGGRGEREQPRGTSARSVSEL